jgi:hypothetical protein
MVVNPPLLPEITILTTDDVTVLGTVMVATLLFPVVDAGLKVTLTPLGKTTAGTASKASNVTLPVNPVRRVIVTVAVALAPGRIVMAAGLTDREKSACGVACALEWINKIADADTNSLR